MSWAPGHMVTNKKETGWTPEPVWILWKIEISFDLLLIPGIEPQFLTFPVVVTVEVTVTTACGDGCYSISSCSDSLHVHCCV